MMYFISYAQPRYNKSTLKLQIIKKVLLRERKRHTEHRVASARYAALSPERVGGSPSSPGWGVPPSAGWVPPCPELEWGTLPHQLDEVPTHPESWTVGQTYNCENITSHHTTYRVVKIHQAGLYFILQSDCSIAKLGPVVKRKAC